MLEFKKNDFTSNVDEWLKLNKNKITKTHNISSLK